MKLNMHANPFKNRVFHASRGEPLPAASGHRIPGSWWRPPLLTFPLGGEADPLGSTAARLVVGQHPQPVGGVRLEPPEAGSAPRSGVPRLGLARSTGSGRAGRAGPVELELIAAGRMGGGREGGRVGGGREGGYRGRNGQREIRQRN